MSTQNGGGVPAGAVQTEPRQVGLPVLTPLGGIIAGAVSLGIIGTALYFIRR